MNLALNNLQRLICHKLKQTNKLNSVVAWMVSTRPLIFKSSSLYINSLVTVPSAPITIGITVTFIFNWFFISLVRSWYLYLFSLSFNVTLWSSGTAMFTYYYYYYFTPLEFFTSVLADGFSLEFEWQQVSSGLQDSSRYSGRLQQCCRLDSLYSSANFQVLQALL